MGHRNEPGDPDPMQQRIDHLEDLVKRLMAQRQEPPPTSVGSSQNCPTSAPGLGMTAVESDASDVAFGAGTTVIDGVYSVYKSADDWHTVLQEVS